MNEQLAMMQRMAEELKAQLIAQAAEMKATNRKHEEERLALRKAQEEKEREWKKKHDELRAQLGVTTGEELGDEGETNQTDQKGDLASLPGIAWALSRLRTKIEKQRERTAVMPVVAKEDGGTDESNEEGVENAFEREKDAAKVLREVRIKYGSNSKEYAEARYNFASRGASWTFSHQCW